MNSITSEAAADPVMVMLVVVELVSAQVSAGVVMSAKRGHIHPFDAV